MGVGLVLYLFICALLIAVSLLNQSQTGGMGILSGSSSTLLGSARSTFLSKVITFLAVIFFIGALFFSIISSGERTILDTVSPDTITPADSTLETDVLDEAALELAPELEDNTLQEELPPLDVPTEENLVPLTPKTE